MKKAKYITLPENWDELTEADWRELLRMRQQLIDKHLKVTIDDVKIETARMLLKNRGVKLQLNNKQYLVLLSQLAKTLTWLWQEHEGGISLVYRSTENLVPKVREWIGPLSHGGDLVFGEFRQATAHLKIYEESQNPQALQALAGLLYRPEANKQQKHEQQLRRQPYDWDSIEDKIKRGQKMQPWQLWGIYAWFAYFCEYLTTGVFVVDGQEVCFAPLFAASSEKKSGNGGSMQQICLTLAESHVFGTAKDVDNTQLLVVMQKLLLDYNTLQNIKKKRT